MPILKRTSLRELLERVVKKVEDGEMTLHNQGVYISQLLKESGVPHDIIWDEFTKRSRQGHRTPSFR